MKIFDNFRLLLSKGFIHLRYTPILGLAALIGLARIGIYARLLNVDEFGLLSKLLLISSFFSVVGSFGFQLLAQRDLPTMFALGRYRKGLVILGKSGIITSLAALAMCLAPLFDLSPLNVPTEAFLFAILHGWAQQIFMLVVINSRSRLQMSRYSLQMLFRTLLSSAAAVIVGVMGKGGVSIVAAEAIITILMAIVMIVYLLRTIGFSVPVFYKLCKKGFIKKEWYVSIVLLIGTTLAFLSTSADRWLAADFLSGKEFGLYSFAWITLATALSIQALLNAGLFPLISRGHVAGSNAFRMTTMVSGGLLIIGLITALIAHTLIIWIIPKWYPQYIDALPLFPPLLLAAAFRVSDFWSSYLIIVHRHNSLLKTQFFLMLFPLLYYIFVSTGSTSMQVPYNLTLLALFLAAGNYVINAFVAFTSRYKIAS